MRKEVSKFMVLAAALFMCLALAAPALALQDDGVESQHIKEADGTTGQDTNTGSGVKTGHIQDGAVTNPKIADGAVTDAKITGPISADKISPHDHDAVYEKKYANVIVVSLDGNGDFTDPVTAMAVIVNATANSPYLVKIMPGVYDIGSNYVQMKQYVDIEGSGQNTTKIIGDYAVFYPDAVGTVRGASNAEIRNLTIENTGTATGYAMAMTNDLSASPRITHVTAIAQSESYNMGIFNKRNSNPIITDVKIVASSVSGSSNYGMANDFGASPRLTNVTITASGGSSTYGIANHMSLTNMESVNVTASNGANNYGIYTYANSNVTISKSRISASGGSSSVGVRNYGSTTRIDQSVISGTTASVDSNGDYTAAYIGSTRLGGGAVIGTGVNVCAGVYDENYIFYADTCP